MKNELSGLAALLGIASVAVPAHAGMQVEQTSQLPANSFVIVNERGEIVRVIPMVNLGGRGEIKGIDISDLKDIVVFGRDSAADGCSDNKWGGPRQD